MTEKELQAYLQGYSYSENDNFTSNIETEEELQAYLQGRRRSEERVQSKIIYEHEYDEYLRPLRKDDPPFGD